MERCYAGLHALGRGQGEEGVEPEAATETAGLRRTNAALRQERDRLRLILEDVTDYAILGLDLEGRITFWNEGARRIFGYAPDEILDQPGAVLFLPEDRAARQAEAGLNQAVERGRAADDRWLRRKDSSPFWATGTVMPMVGADGRLRGFVKLLRDRTERQRQEEQRRLLLREMDHRIKNILAMVQSVVVQTLRQHPAPDGLGEALMARLAALARSHDLLARSGWEGAPLREIVARTLALHADAGGPGRITLAGPPLYLAPDAAVMLNLAFHELATNAAKYGLLPRPEGRVEVRWWVERPADGAPVVEAHWRERGGPPLAGPPMRRGFGSRLIEQGLAREFGAEVRLDFAPEGVECRIRLPFGGRVVVL